MLWRFQFGYQAVNGLLLLTAIALGLGIRYGWRAEPPEPYRLPARLAGWRWVLSAALFAVGVYLFLWPRRA